MTNLLAKKSLKPGTRIPVTQHDIEIAGYDDKNNPVCKVICDFLRKNNTKVYSFGEKRSPYFSAYFCYIDMNISIFSDEDDTNRLIGKINTTQKLENWLSEYFENRHVDPFALKLYYYDNNKFYAGMDNLIWYVDMSENRDYLDIEPPWEIQSFDKLQSGTEESWWFLTTLFDNVKLSGYPCICQEMQKNIKYKAFCHQTDDTKKYFLDVEENEETRRFLYKDPHILEGGEKVVIKDSTDSSVKCL